MYKRQDLTRQQAQDLVSHALADVSNSRTPIDPLRGGMYSSTNLDIEIRMNTNGKTVSLEVYKRQPRPGA